MVRVHVTPRTCFYAPQETPDDGPESVEGGIPAAKLDVMRTTHTNIGGRYNKERVEDTWCGTDADCKSVVVRGDEPNKPVYWTGGTWFRPVAPATPRRGHVWVRGQLARQSSKTSRPSKVLLYEVEVCHPNGSANDDH